MDIISKIVKYKNIIIITVITVAILALIIRWILKKYKNKEGFLSRDDDLLERNETTLYDYIWSNILFLDQYTDENKPESLAIFKNPKIETGNSLNRMLGSIITTNMKDINDTTIMVDKDVKAPTSLKKIVELKDTEESVIDVLTTKDELLKKNAVADNIISKIDESVEFINKNKELYYDNIKVHIHDNHTTRILGGEEINKTNNLEWNNTSLQQVNSVWVPTGSSVSIILNNGMNFNINIGNGETYEEIMANSTGIDSNKFNIFGKNGYSFKLGNNQYNRLLDLNKIANNKHTAFPYNYNLDDNMISYLMGKIGEEVKAIGAPFNVIKRNDDGNDKYYIVDDIAKFIPEKLKNYSLNTSNDNAIPIVLITSKEGGIDIPNNKIIKRDVYSNFTRENERGSGRCMVKGLLNSSGNRKGRTDANETIIRIENSCGGAKDNRDSQDVNRLRLFKAELDDSFEYTEEYDNKNFVLSPNTNLRGYNKNVVKSKNTNSSNVNIGSVNLNPVWNVSMKGYENATLQNDNLSIKFLYSHKDNYQQKLEMRINLTVKDNGTIISGDLDSFGNKNNSSSNSYNYKGELNDNFKTDLEKFISHLFMIKTYDDYCNITKRNIANCLWNEGKVDFENGLFDNSLFNFSFNEHLLNSPIITFKFDTIPAARGYVAGMINNMFSNEFTKYYIRDINSMVLSEHNPVNGFQQKKVIDDKVNELNNVLATYMDSKKSFSFKPKYINISTVMKLYRKEITGTKTPFGYRSLIDGKVSTELFNINELNIRSINVKVNNNPVDFYINKFNDNMKSIVDKVMKDKQDENAILESIKNKSLRHFGLSLYRPVAPKGYKCVGDIAGSIMFNPENNVEKFGCVPENCVIEVRPWLSSDMVYEYEVDDIYFAIYKNPYLHTFKTITSKGTMPEGSVEKVVACVAKCNMVDEIIHSDKCANEYKKGYQNNLSENNLDRNKILYDETESTYRNMIADRQNIIDSLNNQLTNVISEDRKANIINHSYNRVRFQKLLDKQQYNMSKLIKNLFSIISINVNRSELIQRLKEKGISFDDISAIVETTDDINDLGADDTSTTTTAQSSDEMGLTTSGNEPTAKITKPAKLQRILYQTQNGKTQELILRSLVESSCGCYFTDEEVMKR